MLGAACIVALGMVGFCGAGAGCPKGDAANGQRVYLADGCFTCHGRSGQGGNYYGTDADARQDRAAVRRLQAAAARSGAGHAGLCRSVVSDKEAADIYAFLQTLSGRRPVKDFPLLNN